MSVCFDCVIVCVSISFVHPVEQDTAFSHVDVKLNRRIVNADPRSSSLHQVPTSGPALEDRLRPLQTMRTPFTPW